MILPEKLSSSYQTKQTARAGNFISPPPANSGGAKSFRIHLAYFIQS